MVRLTAAVLVILIASAVATVLVQAQWVNSWTNVIVLWVGTLVGSIWLARARPTAFQAWLVGIVFAPLMLAAGYLFVLYFIGYVYGDSL